MSGGAHDSDTTETEDCGVHGGVVKIRVSNRASRLKRRHLNALRRRMHSFEPPPRLKYKRVIPPPDSSNDSDVDEMPEVV